MHASPLRFLPPGSPSSGRSADRNTSAADGSPQPDSGDPVKAHPRPGLPLLLESGLEAAFEAGELDVHYQPILTLDDQKPVGLEALVRWHHPRWGLLPAAAFLPTAQPPTLLPALDLWVLEEACRLAVTFPAPSSGGPPPAIHVNFLPARLQDPRVASHVAATLERTGLAPNRLVIEISEKTLLADPGAGAHLHGLHSLGVRIALDDFGTARLSFEELDALSIQLIKIDRIFVDGLARDPAESGLIAPLIALGRALDLEILAAGIEHPEQAETLLALGCRLGQGYLFSRPLPSRELVAWLDPSAARGVRD